MSYSFDREPKIRCGKCGNPYLAKSLQYMECPHPKVRDKLGKYICVWCCVRCKHFRPIKGNLAVPLRGCHYEEDMANNFKKQK